MDVPVTKNGVIVLQIQPADIRKYGYLGAF